LRQLLDHANRPGRSVDHDHPHRAVRSILESVRHLTRHVDDGSLRAGMPLGIEQERKFTVEDIERLLEVTVPMGKHLPPGWDHALEQRQILGSAIWPYLECDLVPGGSSAPPGGRCNQRHGRTACAPLAAIRCRARLSAIEWRCVILPSRTVKMLICSRSTG